MGKRFRGVAHRRGRYLQLESEVLFEAELSAMVEAAFELQVVEAVDDLDGVHAGIPLSVLGAVKGRGAQCFGVDAELLSVGLDPTSRPGPSGTPLLVVGDGAEQVDNGAGCSATTAMVSASVRVVTCSASCAR